MSDPVTWSEAPQSVIHTAENLIENFHPILKSARIAFVMRSKAQKQGTRYILGQCTKVPDKFKPYLEFDYIIWISEEDYMGMDDLQREALIDHELCHCKWSSKTGTWGIRPHDVQEFSDVIRRHGTWSPDVLRVKDAIDQYQMQPLPGAMDTITFSGAGKVVSLTGEQFDRAAKALEG